MAISSRVGSGASHETTIASAVALASLPDMGPGRLSAIAFAYGFDDAWQRAKRGAGFDHPSVVRSLGTKAADVVASRSPHSVAVTLEALRRAGSVEQAAFALLAAYPYFPVGTVHAVVVDPGVGSERRAVVVEAAGQRFVGPDNGVFSYLLEREADAVVREVTDLTIARTPLSNTFHGRDLFAPVAAALAAGRDPADLGRVLEDPGRLAPLTPSRGPNGLAAGRILHVDRYGNCVTSLTLSDLGNAEAPALAAAGSIVRGLRRQYEGARGGEPFLVEGLILREVRLAAVLDPVPVALLVREDAS